MIICGETRALPSERDWIMNIATRYMWLCNVSLSRCHVWWRVTRDNVVTRRGWGDGSVDHEHWCSIEKSFSLNNSMILTHWSQGVHVTCQLSPGHSSSLMHTCHVFSNCIAANQCLLLVNNPPTHKVVTDDILSGHTHADNWAPLLPAACVC